MEKYEGQERFVEALAGLAELTQFKLTPWVLGLYTEALAPHGLPAATKAIMGLALTARKFPVVADILEVIAPQVVAKIEDVDTATVIAGRIEEALIRYGSQRHDNAFSRQKEHIGEAGWAMVAARWQHFCDTIENDDLPTFKAQMRMELKGVLARAKAGLPAAPGLPETNAPLQPGNLLLAAQREASKGVVVIDRKTLSTGERDA